MTRPLPVVLLSIRRSVVTGCRPGTVAYVLHLLSLWSRRLVLPNRPGRHRQLTSAFRNGDDGSQGGSVKHRAAGSTWAPPPAAPPAASCACGRTVRLRPWEDPEGGSCAVESVSLGEAA